VSAWPQIARCATRQWAGLDPSERARLTVAWACDRLASTSTLKVASAYQQERPLWTVCWGLGHALTLIGLKEDAIERD
jgi:hypothetical protein